MRVYLEAWFVKSAHKTFFFFFANSSTKVWGHGAKIVLFDVLSRSAVSSSPIRGWHGWWKEAMTVSLCSIVNNMLPLIVPFFPDIKSTSWQHSQKKKKKNEAEIFNLTSACGYECHCTSTSKVKICIIYRLPASLKEYNKRACFSWGKYSEEKNMRVSQKFLDRCSHFSTCPIFIQVKTRLSSFFNSFEKFFFFLITSWSSVELFFLNQIL